MLPLFMHILGSGLTVRGQGANVPWPDPVDWSLNMKFQPRLALRAASFEPEVEPFLWEGVAPVPGAGCNVWALKDESTFAQFGDWRYAIKRLPANGVLRIASGNRAGYVRMDGEVLIPGIWHNRKEDPIMSITPQEIFTLRPGVRAAKGHTIIAGLGLGWLLLQVARKRSVTHVTVVEKDAALLREIEPRMRAMLPLGKPVDFVCEDAMTWARTQSADVLLADIFEAYGWNTFPHCPQIKRTWVGRCSVRRLTMNANVIAEYKRFREMGCKGADALWMARVFTVFREQEGNHTVRQRIVPCEEAYDDSYFDTWTERTERQIAHYRKALWATVEREGLWQVDFEVRCQDCGTWTFVQGVSSFVGEPADVELVDCMQETLEYVEHRYSVDFGPEWAKLHKRPVQPDLQPELAREIVRENVLLQIARGCNVHTLRTEVEDGARVKQCEDGAWVDVRVFVPREDFGKPIATIVELANIMGVPVHENAYETRRAIARCLYKNTPSGISFRADEHTVSVSGYCEGSDTELPEYTLAFPFTDKAFWLAVKTADRDACAEWDMTHGCDGCATSTNPDGTRPVDPCCPSCNGCGVVI